MSEQETHHTRKAHLRTDPKTGEKSIPVSDAKVPNRGRKELTPEEQKAGRAAIAGALTGLTKQETMSDFFEPVEDFKELPTPMQMGTIATIADVPWAAAGPPGTGKTVMAKEIGKGLGLMVEVVRAGASTQSDFEGIPAVVGEAGQEVMKRLPPQWAVRVQDENAFLFLDEVNRSPVDTQNSLLLLTGDDRDIEGMDLGPNIRIAAAFNPDDDGVSEFTEALRRRFIFIDWPNDDEAQMRHFATRTYKTFNPATLAGKLPTGEEMRDATDHWANIAYGFHKSTAGVHLHTPPPEDASEDTSQNGYGFPNKGSWESAFRLVAIAESVGASNDVKRNLVNAAVGREAGTAFWGYQDQLDLPDPNDLISNPSSYMQPDRLDKVHLVSNMLVAAVRKEPTPERWAGAVSVLCRMGEDGQNPDIGASTLKDMFKLRKNMPELSGADLPKEDLKKYAKFLADSGIMNY
jgi:hypothetical protein